MPSRARAGWVMAPKITELPDPDHLQVDACGCLALAGVGGEERGPPTQLIGENQSGRDVDRVECGDAELQGHGLGAAQDRRSDLDELPPDTVIVDTAQGGRHPWLVDVTEIHSTPNRGTELDGDHRQGDEPKTA